MNYKQYETSKSVKYFVEKYNSEIGNNLNLLVGKLPKKYKILLELNADLFHAYNRNLLKMRFYSNLLATTKNRGDIIWRGKYKNEMKSALSLMRKVQILFPEIIKQEDLQNTNLSIFEESPKTLVQKTFSPFDLNLLNDKQTKNAEETFKDIKSLIKKVAPNNIINLDDFCSALNETSLSLLNIDYYSEEYFLQQSLPKILEIILLSMELTVLLALALGDGFTLLDVYFLARAPYIFDRLFYLLSDEYSR